jgi:hypothetical protein
MSRVSRADAVSVELTHPLVVSADLTPQVLVSLQIVWPLSGLRKCVRFSLDVQVIWRVSVILAGLA